MLLRVPALHVAHEAPIEGHRLVAIAVGPIERPELLAPFRGLVEPVRVVEGVARLVPEVHPDLAGVLDVVQLLLEAREIGVGQIERDADDRLLIRASPLVGQVGGRAKSLQSLGLQLAIEIGDVAFDR